MNGKQQTPEDGSNWQGRRVATEDRPYIQLAKLGAE